MGKEQFTAKTFFLYPQGLSPVNYPKSSNLFSTCSALGFVLAVSEVPPATLSTFNFENMWCVFAVHFWFLLILFFSEIPASSKPMPLILSHLLNLNCRNLFLGLPSHSLLTSAFSIVKGKLGLLKTTYDKNPSYVLFLCYVYLFKEMYQMLKLNLRVNNPCTMMLQIILHNF